MGNISAFLFLLASFGVPILSSEFRKNQTAIFAAWITLAAHHAVAFFNTFIHPVSQTWGDMYFFHRSAMEGRAGEPYIHILHFIYSIFGGSFWLGSVLSVFTFSLTLILLADSLRLLRRESALTTAVLILGLLPGPLVHRSVPLRESMQALCFAGLLWPIISIHREGPAFKKYAVFIGSFALLSALHHAMIFFGAIATFVIFSYASKSKGSAVNIVILAVTVAGGAAALSRAEFLEKSASVQAYKTGNFLSYATTYRKFVDSARSSYDAEIDTSDAPSFIVSVTQVEFYYFMAPLPWQVSSVIDYLAFGEVVTRIVLFLNFLARTRQGNRNSDELVIVLLTFTMEGIWAIGTANWGTAMRHHIPALLGFVLLGSPSSAWLVNQELKLLQSRQAARRMKAEKELTLAKHAEHAEQHKSR